MKGKANKSGAQRYDDMIGYLVAFEKKANTIEVCCNLQAEALNSNGSSSSSTPDSHIRYARSIKRSHRGRLRDPVPKRNEGITYRNNIVNLVTVDEENHYDNPAKRDKESDHMIIAISDVVEVIMKFNETERSTSAMNEHVKPENYCSTSFDNLEIKTGSSSSSMLIVEQEPLSIGKGDMIQVSEFLQNDCNRTAISQKSSEASILRPSSILKDQQPSQFVAKECIRETKTDPKVIGVVFRDPIFEVIPSKQSSIGSNSCVYNVGDHVEIADGMHSRKIGRIVKTLGDIVQIEVGNVKPMYLYLSPNMLQPLNGQICV